MFLKEQNGCLLLKQFPLIFLKMNLVNLAFQSLTLVLFFLIKIIYLILCDSVCVRVCVCAPSAKVRVVRASRTGVTRL